MKKKVSKLFIKATLATMFLLQLQGISYAEGHKLDFRIEGDLGSQYNSNLVQIKDYPGDALGLFSTTGTMRYISPTQTQVLARVQGQYSKFLSRGEFDLVSIAGSLNLSQWFMNSLNVYVGLQPIQLISLSTPRRPFDMLYMGGATYYLPFGKSDLAFGGYQLDRLQTSAQDFRSWNHTFLLGVRHPLTSNFFLNVGTRAKIRNLDLATGDTRFSGNLSAQYLVNPWLTVQAASDYTYIVSSAAERNVGVYTIGLDLIGGFNHSTSF